MINDVNNIHDFIICQLLGSAIDFSSISPGLPLFMDISVGMLTF